MNTEPRRRFLKAMAAVPLLGSPIFPPDKAQAGAARDYLRELGVKPIINCAGAYTMMTGSLMRPECVDAIEATSKQFVFLDDLHDAVGARIADMLDCEAAMVPSGAAAGLTLGTAACITGTDEDSIRQIPDTHGMKNEVVVQRTHRFAYDHMVRNCGVSMIEVETTEQLRSVVNDRTAMLLFLNKAEPLGQIKMEEFVELGQELGIPTMNDAAADVPPIENLLKPIRLGFDLTVVSGGKGIRGPQSTGLLLGRADLIHAARLNTSPNSDTIGRSCKVNKEEMVGLLVAMESFLQENYDVCMQMWQQRVECIRDAVARIPSVETLIYVPEIANQVPHIRIWWDERRVGISSEAVMRRLVDGQPSIQLVPDPYPGEIEIASQMMQPGEAEVVADQLARTLTTE